MGKTGLTAQPKKLTSHQKETEEGKNTYSLENKPLGTLRIPLSVFLPGGFDAVFSTLTCSRRTQ